jgi:hypothetical protein
MPRLFHISVCLLTLLLTSSVMAADDFFAVPQQKIIGADSPVEVGDLAVLSLSPTDTMPAGLLTITPTWKIYDPATLVEKPFTTDAQGKVSFGTGKKPKKLLALVSVTYLYGIKTADQYSKVVTKTVVLSAVVTIQDSDKPPSPPDDPPSPIPGLIDKFGFIKLSYDTAQDKVPSSLLKVSSARLLAGSFKNIAKDIQNGILKDEDTILQTTKDSNNVILGTNAAPWRIWSDVIQNQLQSLSDSASLTTLQDIQQAWLEIAAGLEKVTK